MSTAVMIGLQKKINEIKRELKKRELSEWSRRYLTFRLSEAEFWLWAQTQGSEERQSRQGKID